MEKASDPDEGFDPSDPDETLEEQFDDARGQAYREYDQQYKLLASRITGNKATKRGIIK